MGGEQHKPQGEGFDKRILAGWSCTRCAGPLVDLHWSGDSGHGEPSPRTACAPRAIGGDFLSSHFPAERKFPRCPALHGPSLSFFLLLRLLFLHVTLISNN